jgi:hypothetical protein
MGVAQAGDGNTTLQIHELSAFLIPHAGAFASHRDNGSGGVVGHHDFIKKFAGDRFSVHGSLSEWMNSSP